MKKLSQNSPIDLLKVDF